jgi:RNA polymerase sigma factor (sigma-70 family)
MTPKSLIEPARHAGATLLRSQTDERLVDLTRGGNERAFEAIVHRYSRPLLRYCARLLPPARAEDAVQQAFVSAHRAIHAGDAELNLRPWLYRIAHNSALNLLRQNGFDHDQVSEEIDGVETPPQAFERGERLRTVVAAVRDLPERQRSAIVLQAVEGRSYDEIASELGVTDGAVRQLLNRARNTLREAAAAITPTGLITRVASGGSESGVAERVAQVLASAGGGALVAKAGAALIVAGAVAGGAATGALNGVGGGGDRHGRGSGGEATAAAPVSAASALPSAGAGDGHDANIVLTTRGPSGSGTGSARSGGRHGGGGGSADGRDDSSGSGSDGGGSDGGGSVSSDDHSGSRGSDDGGGDRHSSGSGSGDHSGSDDGSDDSSGSGSGGSGSDDHGGSTLPVAPTTSGSGGSGDGSDDVVTTPDLNSGSGSSGSGSGHSGSSGSSGSSGKDESSDDSPDDH